MNEKINKFVSHNKMEQFYLSLVSQYHHIWVGFSWKKHLIVFVCYFMDSLVFLKDK